MNKQVLGTTLIAEYPRSFPNYHVCDSGVTNSSALLEGEFTRKHRRYDRFSTHTLLYSDGAGGDSTCSRRTACGMTLERMRSCHGRMPHFGHEVGETPLREHLAPQRWTLRDVLHAISSEAIFRSVSSATNATNHYVDQYFQPKTTLQNILSAIATHMAPYRAIASAWHRAAEVGCTFSLDD